MSFGWNAWNHAVIDPAIQEAFNAGLVMCVATHNHNTQNGVTYPATNPLVIAVGASDQADNRKSPTSPDGEGWGSNYGPQVSGRRSWCPDPHHRPAGQQRLHERRLHRHLQRTSAATPHVAALRGADPVPQLLAQQCRRPADHRDDGGQGRARCRTPRSPGHANGTWNQEMGYGRIDVHAAIRAARRIMKRLRFEDDIFKLRIKEVLRDIDVKDRFKEMSLEIPDIFKRVGREEPDILDLGEEVVFPVRTGSMVSRRCIERLDRIERRVGSLGAPFVGAEDRPDVSGEVVEAAVAVSRNGDGRP